MALVIVSAGTLASSRLRTVKLRPLAAVAGALAVAGLLGGFTLGYQLGGDAREEAAGAAGFAELDASEPGNQALIREIGSLSGRVIQLEALANRLSRRVGTASPRNAVAAESPGKATHEPAGGPLLEAVPGERPGTAASLHLLGRGLDDIEVRLDGVASMVARRDLDGMAFPSRPPIPGVEASSGFGRRIDPFTQRPARHAGLDFTAPHGTSILASAGGKVRRAGPYGAYGRTVEIDHGDGLVTRYGHVYRTVVRVGDIVLPGQPIATVGSSGRSTGPHLHFEILRDGRPVHPELYLAGDDG
jgi:murein DD-endopeptidase MepM/ murein hydrolase activator NlpD